MSHHGWEKEAGGEMIGRLLAGTKKGGGRDPAVVASAAVIEIRRVHHHLRKSRVREQLQQRLPRKKRPANDVARSPREVQSKQKEHQDPTRRQLQMDQALSPQENLV